MGSSTVRKVAFVAVLALLLAAGSAVAATPKMTPADRAAIGATVDRFVKDVLLRQDLADGWDLAGPHLRAGTTRAAWVNGTGVTVEAYPAKGSDFSRSWTGKLVGPGHAVLSMVALPKPGASAYQKAFTIDLRKVGGRWLVDIFYPAATFRLGKHQGSCGLSKCAISGPADFSAQGGSVGAGGAGATTKGRIGTDSFAIAIAAIGAIVVLTPLGFWARARRRNRRAMAAYLATRGD